MSEEQNPENKEARILSALKKTLTGVIKDTSTPAGMRHPLKDATIEDIRQCLILITSREQELAGGAGSAKPRYVDEPQDSVVVQLHTPGDKQED